LTIVVTLIEFPPVSVALHTRLYGVVEPVVPPEVPEEPLGPPAIVLEHASTPAEISWHPVGAGPPV
jgi:hypothetical protein